SRAGSPCTARPRRQPRRRRIRSSTARRESRLLLGRGRGHLALELGEIVVDGGGRRPLGAGARARAGVRARARAGAIGAGAALEVGQRVVERIAVRVARGPRRARRRRSARSLGGGLAGALELLELAVERGELG